MHKSYAKVIFSLLIWGTLPIFVRQVSHSSEELVAWRLCVGLLVVGIVCLIRKEPWNRDALKKYGLRLLFTGMFMGSSWIFLFNSYRYVDASISTLSYYCSPILVMMLSPLLLKEKFSFQKLIGMGAAVLGMIFVTGAEMGGSDPMRGVLLGLISAAFYSILVLSDKTVHGLSGLQITLIQIIGGILCVIPYNLISHQGPWIPWEGTELAVAILLGLVHSGLALILYFSAIQELPGQTVALLSYIDPASALLFSALFLHETMSPLQWLGAVLIIGGAAFGELGLSVFRRKTQN